MSAGIREVVVGYDGSEHAKTALETARRFTSEEAGMTIVYAYRVPPEEAFEDRPAEVLATVARERGADVPAGS